MSLEGKSLFVATPMYGGMCSFNYKSSFGKLVQEFTKRGLKIGWSDCYNESIIQLARNTLVHDYLTKSKMTHVLLVDGDIGFEARDVVGILDLDYDIVGIPCPKKMLRWDRVQKAIEQAPRSLMPAEMAYAAQEPIGYYESYVGLDVWAPQPMLATGTGFMMVRREVFEKLKEAFPDRWYYSAYNPIATNPIDGTPGPGAGSETIHEYFSAGINPESHMFEPEDLRFCMDCRRVGIKIFQFPWINSSHWGNQLFLGNLPMMASLTGMI
jgi:hypothetical protein